LALERKRARSGDFGGRHQTASRRILCFRNAADPAPLAFVRPPPGVQVLKLAANALELVIGRHGNGIFSSRDASRLVSLAREVAA
jgi:hypothetical protein